MLPSEAMAHDDIRGERLVALRTFDPKRWRDIVRAALKRHEGNRTRAARELEIGLRTLGRWIDADPAIASKAPPAKSGRRWDVGE